VTQCPRVWVAGLAWCDWPESRVDAYAKAIEDRHSRDRPLVEFGWRPLAVKVNRHGRCVACGQSWPCEDYSWAGMWFSTSDRGRLFEEPDTW
jgi:hypothetical protein